MKKRKLQKRKNPCLIKAWAIVNKEDVIQEEPFIGDIWVYLKKEDAEEMIKDFKAMRVFLDHKVIPCEIKILT